MSPPHLERRVPGDLRLEGPWQELLCLAQLWLQGTSGQDLVVQVLLQPELGRMSGMGLLGDGMWDAGMGHEGWLQPPGMEGAQSSWELCPTELFLAFPRDTGQLGDSGEGQAWRGQSLQQECPLPQEATWLMGTGREKDQPREGGGRRDLSYTGRVIDGLCAAAEVAKTPT